MEKNIIPRQEKGASTNVVEHINLSNKQEAQQQFVVSRKRLLDISYWGEIANGPSSEFCLTDKLGNELTRPAAEGDHIKINLPGPGTWIGGGNDWVIIESINDYTDKQLDEEITVLTVRPCANPLSGSNKIAHFFKDTATSTFLVKRRGNDLYAQVHGRNESPNTQSGLIDNLRNRLIALSAMAGFSNPQWKMLAKGLIDTDSGYSMILPPLPKNILHYVLEDDGIFPNSSLPVLIYKNGVPLPDDDSPQLMEDIFEQNNWSNSWRNGIYDVHHYHSITHEVLGIYCGVCKIILGGEKGLHLSLEKGDVLIIPAGVAHKNLDQSDDFKCVGAYPDGKDFDLNYGKRGERPQTDQNTERLVLPKTDPLYGKKGLLLKYWK